MSAEEKKSEKIVNLNEDSRQHGHDDAGYQKMMRAKQNHAKQQSSDKK